MTEMRRVLVLNSHEAWVSQLDGLPFQFDIAVGLSGRVGQGWDERMRPIPRNARLIDIKDALLSTEPYGVAVGHSVTDLLEIKRLEIPKLFVIHTTLEGRLAENPGQISAKQLSDETKRYLKLIKAHVISVSKLKAASWSMPNVDLVGFSVNVEDYPLATQEKAHGLRISNQFNARRTILMADFHEQAFRDLPIRFVGVNDDMPGVTAATEWSDLKQRIAESRFYIHTADPTLEDGYNMATVEAMASGLPVLGNLHPTSAIEHGVSGFLSDNPEELRSYAQRLLDDKALSLKMGTAARARAAEFFSRSQFEEGFLKALSKAKAKFHDRGSATKKKTRKKKKR